MYLRVPSSATYLSNEPEASQKDTQSVNNDLMVVCTMCRYKTRIDHKTALARTNTTERLSLHKTSFVGPVPKRTVFSQLAFGLSSASLRHSRFKKCCFMNHEKQVSTDSVLVHARIIEQGQLFYAELVECAQWSVICSRIWQVDFVLVLCSRWYSYTG